jgi:hypothetical protein
MARTNVLDGQHTVSVVLDTPSLNWFKAVINRLEKHAGFRPSNSAAMRTILAEHKAFTEAAQEKTQRIDAAM